MNKHLLFSSLAFILLASSIFAYDDPCSTDPADYLLYLDFNSGSPPTHWNDSSDNPYELSYMTYQSSVIFEGNASLELTNADFSNHAVLESHTLNSTIELWFKMEDCNAGADVSQIQLRDGTTTRIYCGCDIGTSATNYICNGDITPIPLNNDWTKFKIVPNVSLNNWTIYINDTQAWSMARDPVTRMYIYADTSSLFMDRLMVYNEIGGNCPIASNNIPTMSTVNISPNFPKTNDTLLSNWTASDIDSDPLTPSFKWYDDTNDTGITTSTFDCNLVSGCDKYSNITLSIRVFDGTDYSSWLNNSLIIQNSDVNLTSTSIVPTSPYTNDTLICNWTALDIDDDPFNSAYLWWDDDTLTSVTTQTYDCNSEADCDVGNILTCSINASDDLSQTNFSTNASVTILNYPTLITLVFPTDEYHTNIDFNFTYNISDVDGLSDVLFCDLYLNYSGDWLLYDTNSPPVIVNNISYDVGESENNNTYWFVNCTDASSNVFNSSIFHYVIDTINPIITWTLPLASNTTISGHNLSLNITCTDDNLYGVLVNITDSSNNVIYSESYIDLASTSYTTQDVINFTYTDNYTVTITCSDDHTDTLINTLDISKDVSKKSLQFDDISIKLISLQSIDDIITSKLSDRYSFEFKPSLGDGKQTYSFELSAKHPIIYRRDSPYTAHFVIDNKWVDFVLDDKSAIYNIYNMGKNWYVDITTDQPLNFKSIGGLNTISSSSSYYFEHTSPTRPLLLAPIDNTINTTINVEFTWSQVVESYFNNYTLQIDNDNDFSSIDIQNYTFDISSTSLFTEVTHDTWYWRVIAYDSYGNSNISATYTYIHNNIPSVSLASINPVPLYSNMSAHVSYIFTDIDSDTNQSIYQWFVNDSLVVGATDNNLSISYFNGADNLTCQITPYDGIEYGISINASIIANYSAPSISDLTIIPSIAYTSTDINFSYTFNDFDSLGDFSIFQWLVDGINTSTDRILNHTYHVKNDNVTIIVTPYNGYSYGSPVNTSIIISNSPPNIATLSPVVGRFSNNFQINCLAEDIDNDPLNYTIRIYETHNGSEDKSWYTLINSSATNSLLYYIRNYPRQTKVDLECNVSESGNSSLYGINPNGTISYADLIGIDILSTNTLFFANYSYMLGIQCDIPNTNNFTVMGSYADCNDDNIWDYYFNYNWTDTKFTRDYFYCINVYPGEHSVSAGCVITKPGNHTWIYPFCENLQDSDVNCIWSTAMGIQVTR